MKHRTSTTAGRALYGLRKQTVEPVIGIIKAAMGFLRFSMRGDEKAGLEWTLVCLALQPQTPPHPRSHPETGVNEGKNRPHHLQTQNSSNSIP
jgi:hypothetical protein